MVFVTFIIPIIALVVAIMALPTVFQMIFGKPNIDVEFVKIASELRCLLYNFPIRNNFLLRLGVYKRTAEHVFIAFSVWNKQKRQYIGQPKMNAAIKRNGEETRGIALPASKAFASVLIVQATIKEGAFLIARGESRTLRYPLQPGHYHAEIKIAYSEYVKTVQKWFSVGKTPADLHWLKWKPPQNSSL